MENLLKIQSELKAPKKQFNKFGKYYYRNCEDILEAVKPLLLKYNCIMTIRDEIITVNDRSYVQATVNFSDGEKEITVTASAREEEVKKGMDGSQITGSSSSYARKYALNGLFLIDDNKESDTTNVHKLTTDEIKNMVEKSKSEKDLLEAWKQLDEKQQETFKQLFNTKKSEL